LSPVQAPTNGTTSSPTTGINRAEDKELFQ
jgi:hypothetical protein